MPVANSPRQISVTAASSVLTCLQVTHYNPGSRIPAHRAEPTPVHMLSAGGTTLSKGEMAGVVVTVVLGFCLLITALVMWWLRHRKASRAAQPFVSESPAHGKDSQIAVETEEIGNDGARYELDPTSQRLAELLDIGSNGPVELAASNIETRRASRLPL
jgi:type IV secretory pathway TrbD component